MENEQNHEHDQEDVQEGSRYPIFVTRKKKTAKFAETAITRCIPFSFADDVSDTEWEKEASVEKSQHHHSDSPVSELGSEQCLSSDASCPVGFATMPPRTDNSDCDDSDEKDTKRPKRKKNKERKSSVEVNPAVDAIRYKTKMCKNWQLYEKCPYGPRCLFAHGAKELRTYTLNHSAIATAASSSSPERQFYAVGHFPSFMPVPFLGEEKSQASSASSQETSDQPHSESWDTTTTKSASPAPVSSASAPGPQAVTTHSPYTPAPPPPSLDSTSSTASSHGSTTPTFGFPCRTPNLTISPTPQPVQQPVQLPLQPPQCNPLPSCPPSLDLLNTLALTSPYVCYGAAQQMPTYSVYLVPNNYPTSIPYVCPSNASVFGVGSQMASMAMLQQPQYPVQMPISTCGMMPSDDPRLCSW